ncbi:hypothetical protein [Streptomyces sp. NPDC051776]|uniref:hypothetical protein n=1 Tax=Streptomyces sp. NPDC051776 TaxID=3155414 RepID=UPI0034458789
MRRVAAATAVVMAMAGVTSFGAGAAFADNKPGGATVTGGSATGTDLDLIQDNSAQEGRLNSLCGQLNNASLSPEGVRTRGRCLNHDGSVNAFAHTRSKGAHVEGGTGGAEGVEFNQQNIAQKGRLNNACADQNDFNPSTLEGSRLDSDCRNKDRSFSLHTLVTSGGARVEGGSAATNVEQQNIAQEGRLNNACADTNDLDPTIEDSRVDSDCRNKDGSVSNKVLVKSGGARIEGGSSSAANVEQQSIAQEGRQNNACANFEDSDFTLDPGRLDSDCRNKDGSFNKKVLVKSGGARIEGGSSSTSSVAQQNIAQEGRQNNACANGEDADFTLDPGRLDSDCRNKDRSVSKKVLVKSGGARIEGGSSSTSSVAQQNIAQEGRLNNACANLEDADFTLTGGRLDSDCRNKDGSFNKKVLVKSGGARIEGGNATSTVGEQNVAQEGRQNNACVDGRGADFSVDPGRLDSDCGNNDDSVSKKVLVKSGGARIEGGSATSTVQQQNIAQEGRQNNACANLEDSDFTLTGGRVDSDCRNKDGSFNKKVRVKSGGARIEGSSATSTVEQQNIAQEGRQNNACANLEDSDFSVDPGRVDTDCRNKDGSFNKKVLVKGRGAHIEGGSSSIASVEQQNIAQDGRQNNACANGNDADFTLTGGRLDAKCGNKDHSFNKHMLVKGGGAHVEGGSTTAADVFQYNVAQEGRQNNACANPNEPATLDVTDGRVDTKCGNKDHSFNKHVLVKDGGARAEGGSSTATEELEAFQYNTAQSGRQNNGCANPNEGDITLTGSRVENRCKTIDESKNLGTKVSGGGALAEGGSSTADLFQQNTAQTGRQSNHCGNPNNLTLTATGSRAQSHCTAADRSTNIGTINR